MAAAGDSFSARWRGLYAHDHLLAAQKGVANELARAQSHLGVRHLGWLIGVDRGRRVVFCVGVAHLLCFKRRRESAEPVRISFGCGADVPSWHIAASLGELLDVHV